MKTITQVLFLTALGCTACTRPGGAGLTPNTKSPETSARKSRFSVVDLFDFEHRQVRNFEFCPVTRKLYVSFTDIKNDVLYEWDLDNGEIAHKYRLGDGYMCDSIAISPDGHYLVVGCWPLDSLQDCKTLIVDTTKKRIATTLPHKKRTARPQFSTDGSIFWTDRNNAFDLAGLPVSNVLYKNSEPRKRSAWRIISMKTTLKTHGLYFRDATGRDHRLTQNEWHNNYCVTKDKKFIMTTTWNGELIVWQTDDCIEVYRRKLAFKYGYLAYDPDRNRVLLGDATHDGTTFLRALVIGSNATGPSRIGS